MANTSGEIDEAAVKTLGVALAAHVKQHYLDGGRSRKAVYEVLNAIAAVTANVLAGTGEDMPRTWDFFCQAVSDNLAEIQS